ncbi:MAG: MraY family glycosyltransferase [Candidatus Limnocylindrales bacterium]
MSEQVIAAASGVTPPGQAITTELVTFLLVALAVAGSVSFLLTPVAMRIARLVGAIDAPDHARRVHRLPVARLGGIAVGTTFIVVGIAAVAIGRDAEIVRWAQARDPQLTVLFLGVAVAIALGAVDDRWQIRARYQLLWQVALAGIAISGGVLFTRIANPFQVLSSAIDPNLRFDDLLPFEILGYPAAPVLLTALWIVGMINSINWIDGLDGLSTGVSLIAAVTLGIVSITVTPTDPMVGLLCMVLAGSLAGFLPWNFHPARIFIGTGGVMAVGYALAVLSILGTAKVAVALLILGVPIIDTFWIIIRRIATGSSPFEPDRGHLHHRLLDLGLSHRGAVLLIYAMSVVLGLAGIVLSSSGAGPLYAFVGVVLAGGVVLYLVTRHTNDSLDASSYPDDPPEPPPASRPQDSGPSNSSQATATPGHGTRPAR